jgi:type I restriction enzyme S subunit
MVSGVGTIGKVYVVKDDDRFYYKDASVLCLENRSGLIDSRFARYMLESEFMQAQMQDNSKGTTVDTITISAAMEYVCVLPPLEEQKRIVAAIEKAFAYLNSIAVALT